MATDPNAHLPIDQSVTVPAAVRAAGAAADRMQALLAAGEPPPPGTLTVPLAGKDPPFAQAPPLGAEPPTFTPATPSQSQAPPQAQPQPNGQMPDWENLYKANQGRLTAERTQTARRIQQLEGQVNDLMSQLQTRGPAQPGVVPPGNGGIPPGATEQDLRDFGPEMMAAIDRIATARAAAAVQPVIQHVDQRAGQTEEQMAMGRQVALEGALDQAYPSGQGVFGWREVNESPQFAMWLQGQDGFSSLSRQDVLNDAHAKGDIPRVLKIFTAFMQQATSPATGQGPGASPGAVPPGSPPPSQRLPMSAFAGPGPARPAGAPPGGGAPEINYYTPTQIADFFRRKGRGEFNNSADRRAWAEAMEADVFRAQSEGRVVNG
jgi:hypothetical protein